ncbi:MAG TPA: hypothetical protein VMU81_16500 [Acetobacteraceae bacterium]|nr:hypothetical protein [Acetobacteraceae bacterium]
MAAAFGSIVLVAGCGVQNETVWQLNRRMQIGLAPQVAQHKADVQQLKDGTQITLAEDTLFVPGSPVLSPQGRFVLASVIEGLMAPPLMQIELTPSASTSPYLRQARVAAVRQFFTDYTLGPQLLASVSAPAPGASPTMAITVHVLPNWPG